MRQLYQNDTSRVKEFAKKARKYGAKDIFTYAAFFNPSLAKTILSFHQKVNYHLKALS